MDKQEESYVNYLKSLVRIHNSDDYEVLLDRLWRKEFYSILPNDENRAMDGLYLREMLDEYVDLAIFGPCRILEMLIALSRRMEYDVDKAVYDEDYVDLFWEMLNNLDLLKFTNSVILEDAISLELDHILTVWLDRKYASDGTGGLFPIKGWKRGRYKAQYKVEMWYQMMLYLQQNYIF